MTPTKYSIAPGHPGPRKVSPNMRTDIGPRVSSNAGRVTVSRYGTSRAWAQRGNGQVKASVGACLERVPGCAMSSCDWNPARPACWFGA